MQIEDILNIALNQLNCFFNQIYWYLYFCLDKVEISGYFIIGYIVFLEVTGIGSIIIDIVIEDIIKPRKFKIKRYEDYL